MFLSFDNVLDSLPQHQTNHSQMHSHTNLYIKTIQYYIFLFRVIQIQGWSRNHCRNFHFYFQLFFSKKYNRFKILRNFFLVNGHWPKLSCQKYLWEKQCKIQPSLLHYWFLKLSTFLPDHLITRKKAKLKVEKLL